MMARVLLRSCCCDVLAALLIVSAFVVTFVEGGVTRDANAIVVEETDANGLPLLLESSSTTVLPPSPKDPTKSKIPEERIIDRQVKQVKKMKCKPRQEKVFTRDYLTGDQQDLRVIFPEVLSVKRCDVKCTYCNQKKNVGLIEDKLCLPTKERKKKYIVRGYKSGGETIYIEVPIPVHKKCECKAPGT